MAWLVDDAFEDFHALINLPGDHRSLANDRQEWIESRLRPKFEILDAFATGSIPRFTALEGYADLDVLVVLHHGEHIRGKSPAQVLNDVRDALGSSAGSVRRNGQAVTMRFASWPDVDVVPASVTWSDRDTKAVRHYSIPDMHRGEWLKTRPRNHSKNVKRAAERCGPLFRQVIKLIKEWNRRQAVRLQSYHIEVIALKMLDDFESFDEYGWSVLRWFEKAQTLMWLCDYDGHDAADYLGYSDTLTLLDALSTAEDLATDAWRLTYDDRSDHKGAITLWRTLFGQRFPTYGPRPV